MQIDNNLPQLQQLLQDQLSDPSKQLFPLSYASARYTQPTPNILYLLNQLQQQDKIWINVIERLAQNDIQMVFSAFQNSFAVYKCLIHICFVNKYQEGVSRILSFIIDFLKNEIPLAPIKLGFEIMSAYLVQTVDMDNNLQHISLFFQNQPALFIMSHIRSSQCLIKCLIILVEKFVTFQRKNLMWINSTQFREKYCQFNLLLMQVFEMSISNPPHITCDMLEVMCHLSSRHQLYDLHKQHMPALIEICELGLISFNEHVCKEFKNNPEQSLNYQNDLIQNQRSGTLFSQTAKLLQHLCRNIDGMLSTFFRNILSVLTHIFKAQQPNNSTKVELLYLQLLIINKTLKTRKDLMEELTEFLGDYSGMVFQLHRDSLILNYRLIKIIEVYINELPSRQFDNVLLFLINSLCEPESEGFVMQVYSSLHNLVEGKEFQRQIQNCLPSLSSHLIMYIQKMTTRDYFDWLKVLLCSYDTLADRYCIKILTNLSMKAHSEVRKCWENGQKLSQALASVYNCILSILKKQTILGDLYDQIEPILLQHAAYLQNPNSIEFEDKILQMAALVVKAGKEITHFVIVCLKSVTGVYEKNQDLDYTFELFYSICRNGHLSALGMTDIVEFMISIGRRFLKQQDRDHMGTGVYNRGCIIIQILLQTFGDCLSTGQYREALIGELISIMNNQPQITQHFKNILISLYYIRQFPLNMPFDKLSDRYSNKMWNIYLTLKLRERCTQQNLTELLNYLQIYIDAYLFTSKKSEIDLEDYEEEMMNTLIMPMDSINDLQLNQTVIKELKQNKMIDLLELSPEHQSTLELVLKLDWCNKFMRKVYKFVTP